jgi:phage/plasmid-like protein (TIGR03299 family)
MSHAILENDKGAVGFTSILGKTWHGVESYRHFEGPINIEVAERIADYEVVKMPLFMQKPMSNGLTLKKEVPKAYCLYRTDTDTILHPNVGEQYEIISNMKMLGYLKGIFADYQNLAIESIGTLNNGQNLFVNLNVTQHTVKGDISPTVTRLMFTNAYGGKTLTACIHQTRVVCMNTVRVATAQGKANDTLKRFKHTKNVSMKVENHVIDLASIVGEVREHNVMLDQLAESMVNTEYVNSFLENMFPTEEKEGASLTKAKNKQDAVLNIFEGKADLRSLANSRYKLLNAVTDYTSNSMSLQDGDDAGKRFMNVAQSGSGDKLNQMALQLLTV